MLHNTDLVVAECLDILYHMVPMFILLRHMMKMQSVLRRVKCIPLL